MTIHAEQKAFRSIFFGIFILLATPGIHGQNTNYQLVRNAQANASTALQFFWFGDMESHFRLPMNFYVVAKRDKRLHSVKVPLGLNSEGVATYISLAEMQALIEKFQSDDLMWDETNKIRRFGPWSKIVSDDMKVSLVSSKGTSVAHVRIARMCDTLQPFDKLMPTKLILWQFQEMRFDNGCVIPGFVSETRPGSYVETNDGSIIEK